MSTTPPALTLERHRHVLLDREADSFEHVTAEALIVSDGVGPTVRFGPWDVAPGDARLLAQSLAILADLAEGVQP